MQNLTTLINTVIHEHPQAHAHKIATLVAERVEPEHLLDYLIAALEPMVADRIRLSRNSTMNSKKSRSPKTEERRNWWQRLLREKVHIGDCTWKPLGDCTIENLEYCISERQDQIGAIMGQIAKFEAIADAMRVHGVVTVAELPDTAVEL